jgi:hypothetical protein
MCGEVSYSFKVEIARNDPTVSESSTEVAHRQMLAIRRCACIFVPDIVWLDFFPVKCGDIHDDSILRSHFAMAKERFRDAGYIPSGNNKHCIYVKNKIGAWQASANFRMRN